MLEVFDALPWTPSPLAARPLGLLITAGVLVFAVLRGVGATHTRRVWLMRSAAAMWCALLLPWTPAPDRLELVALDVGHGTAVAMRAPGPVYWLFDCGSRDRTRVVQDALGPLLARWEVRELHVALSHTDRDHAGGLDWVVERYGVGSWIGALSAPLGERLPHTAPRWDIELGLLRVPCTENPALALTLLRGCNAPGNEGSRSLLVEFGGRSALLSGDAQDDGLHGLLALEPIDRPCDLLLCPHHGAQSPWLGALLDACRPREVWISASARAPAEPEVERRAINLALTRRDGPLTWSARAAPRESWKPP
jgi:competence protein ComEC